SPDICQAGEGYHSRQSTVRYVVAQADRRRVGALALHAVTIAADQDSGRSQQGNAPQQVSRVQAEGARPNRLLVSRKVDEYLLERHGVIRLVLRGIPGCWWFLGGRVFAGRNLTVGLGAALVG